MFISVQTDRELLKITDWPGHAQKMVKRFLTTSTGTCGLELLPCANMCQKYIIRGYGVDGSILELAGREILVATCSMLFGKGLI